MKRLFLLLLVLGLSIALFIPSPTHALLSGWGGYYNVTFTATDVAGNYTFEVWVLNDTNNQDDGGDIRLTRQDDTTIPQICNPMDNGTYFHCVGKDWIDGVDSFLVQQDNPGASEKRDELDIFTNARKGAYYFAEAGTTVYDSLEQGYNGTVTNGIIVDGQLAFDGTNGQKADMLDLWDHCAGGEAEVTQMIRVTENGSVGTGRMFTSGADDTGRFFYHANATYVGGASVQTAFGLANYPITSSQMVTSVFDTGSMRFYLNGTSVGYRPSGMTSPMSGAANEDLNIGSHDDGDNSFNFLGQIEEYFCFNVAQDANYVGNLSLRKPTSTISGFTAVSEDPFTFEDFVYDTPIYDLTTQDFSIWVSYNSSIIDNVTLNGFQWNNTAYPITLYDLNSSAERYNATWNVTDFVVQLQDTNNANMTVNWTYTIQYSNFTNLTQDNTNTQNVDWGHTLDSVQINMTNVLETQTFLLTGTATNNSEFGTLTQTLTYNGTNYTGFSKELTAPLVTADTVYYYTAWMNVSYNNTSRFTNISGSHTVSDFNITDCSTGIQALNFTTYDEENPDTAVTSNLTISLNATFSGLNLTSGFTSLDDTSHEICISPNWSVMTNVDSFVIYEAEGWHPRQWWIINGELDNTTSAVNLYLLNDTLGDLTTFSVTDNLGQSQEEVVVKIQRWYNGESAYRTIGMVKTDTNGEGSTYIRLDDPFYRFVMDLDAVTLDTTTIGQITSTSVSLQVGTGAGESYRSVGDGLVGSLTFNQSGNNFLVASITDTKNLVVNGNLTVYQGGLLGDFQICNDLQTGSGAITMHCNTTLATGTDYIVVLTTSTETNTYYIYNEFMRFGPPVNNFGIDGLLMVVLLVITFFMLGQQTNYIWSLVGGVLATGIGLLFQITPFSLGAFISVIIASFMVVFVNER